jgi:hypothetical protein
MTDLRRAVEQATKALELAQIAVYWLWNRPLRKVLRKAEKDLRLALAEPTNCAWEYDHEEDSWNTECGNKFSIEHGTPTENKMKYCCFCGKHINDNESGTTGIEIERNLKIPTLKEMQELLGGKND